MNTMWWRPKPSESEDDVELGAEKEKDAVVVEEEEDPTQSQRCVLSQAKKKSADSVNLSLIIGALLVSLGIAASAAVLTMGITTNTATEEVRFEEASSALVKTIHDSWTDYGTSFLSSVE
jgi:multisubunit Na+/H+ antiporter MnhC subunit